MSVKSPAFQFYANDFLALVATFTLEETGAFMTLLAADWSQNGIPADLEKLARLLRLSRRKFDAVWAVIGEHFVERDGRRYNPTLDLERQKQAQWREKSAKGGKASGEARSKGGVKGGSTTLEPPHEPNANTSPSSSTSVTAKSSTARPAAPVGSEAFDRAWSRYPRRSGSNSRGDAWKSWLARLSRGTTELEMERGTERYEAWCRATGKYGTELVMQGKRFYGPGEHFLEPWDIEPEPQPTNGKPRQLAAVEMLL